MVWLPLKADVVAIIEEDKISDKVEEAGHLKERAS